ncbi:MAG: hypothetical protein ACLRSW_08795 [Christensenellaceae bacterium]
MPGQCAGYERLSFNLNADGTFTIVNWGEGTKNETAPADMKLTVLNKDTKPEVYFTLPRPLARETPRRG